MVRVSCWMTLAVMVALQAKSQAEAQHATRAMIRDSDEDKDNTSDSKISEGQIRERIKSDNEADSNSRSGRQLSRFGQNPYDQQLRFSQFGSTNLLGTRNRFGSSTVLGSGGLNGLNTNEILDAFDYNTRNHLGGSQFGSRLNTYPGPYPLSGGSNNRQLSNSQLLGSRLGSNYQQRNNFGTGVLTNGLLSSQRLGNSQLLRNQRLGNHLSTRSQLVNTLRNQYAASQHFGNQILTPEGVARTVVHDSQNDGFGQYSYQFETDNGIVQEQSGQPVGPNSYSVTGSYSYTSPEGELVTVRYVADENGFQVESPNVPPMPEHARLQVLAAQRARNLGLIDSNGNPTGLRTSFDNLGYSNGNLLGSAGLGLNRNIGLASRPGLLNSGSRSSGLQNFNALSNGFRSGNLVRTSVLKRPILGSLKTAGIYDQDVLDKRTPNSQSVILSRIGTILPDSSDYNANYNTNRYVGNEHPLSFRRQNLGTSVISGQYPQLAASSRSLKLPQGYTEGPYDLFSTHSNLDQQYSNADSFANLNTGISSFSDPYDVELLPRFERLRASNTGAFGSPFFQRQTASRFAIQDGDLRRLRLGLPNFRGKPADIALATNRASPISNNVASYIYRS